MTDKFMIDFTQNSTTMLFEEPFPRINFGLEERIYVVNMTYDRYVIRIRTLKRDDYKSNYKFVSHNEITNRKHNITVNTQLMDRKQYNVMMKRMALRLIYTYILCPKS